VACGFGAFNTCFSYFILIKGAQIVTFFKDSFNVASFSSYYDPMLIPLPFLT
jgi:hypothetical protein